MPKPPKPPRHAHRHAAAPGSASALRTRGIQHYTEGRHAEAAALLRQALAAHPRDAVALYHLSAIALQARQPAQALQHAERAVQHMAVPMAPVWALHAVALQGCGRFDDALASFERALAIDPACVTTLVNHGVLLVQMMRRQDGLEQFLKVLDIDPDNVPALSNAASTLTELQGCHAAAAALFRRLVCVSPGHPYALGRLCFEGLRRCDWSDFDRLAPLIVQDPPAAERIATPFTLLALADSARIHSLAARQFSADLFPAAAAPLWNGERYRHARLHVAYVSPDFREHPVSHLLAGVLEAHDRSRFEVFAFSRSADDGSPLRARVAAAFEHFIDVAGHSPLQIAQALRAHEIDVAIDLAGFTQSGSIDAFAHRPAPVQATYLGYPGTLGTSYFDYIVADAHVIPERNEPFFSEAVWRLPGCFLPPASGPLPADRTPTRAECGLPDNGVVLCCFNHDFKLHPAMFALWMGLLQQRPGSVLWLSCRAKESQANLRAAAARAGIDPARLVFAGWVPRVEDHLARYRLADLFVDTVPYNAHTTAADALAAGLPVLTCMGDAFPARVAGSLLHAIGMEDLATPSLEAYRALALDLMASPERLAGLKRRLAANRATHRLFDTAHFCRGLEDAFVGMQCAKLGAAAAQAVVPPPAALAPA